MRQTLDALGFKPGEIFQLVAINGPLITAASFSEADLAWEWAARPGNIYIVGNPLRAHRGSKAREKDIAVARVLLLDADPVKTDDDPDGLSETSRAACLEFVDEVNTWCELACGSRMPVCDSGRGYQMWIHTDVTDRRSFLLRLAAQFARDGVKVDATHDASRLVRLPGTVNSKTGRAACLL